MVRPSMLALVLLATGCGSSLSATGRQVTPALLPIRSFPVVFVVSGSAPHERELATRLIEEIGTQGQSQVRWSSYAEMDALRELNRIPAGAAVLSLELVWERDSRTRWVQRPERWCDRLGCSTRYRTVPRLVPTRRGRARIAIFDAPTARRVDGRSYVAAAESFDGISAEARVVSRLAESISADFDQRIESIQVELVPTDDVTIDSILERIEVGDWQGGRGALERIARTERGLSREAEAAFQYNLAVARQYASLPDESAETRFDAAESAIAQAISSHPQRLYVDQRERLRAHRAVAREVEVQRSTARDQFGIGGDTPAAPSAYAVQPPALPAEASEPPDATPPPPPGYR